VVQFDIVRLMGPFIYPVVLFAAGLVFYGLLYLFQRARSD